MQAAVYYQNGGPEVLTYETVPDPHPGANEVLIRVQAISIEGADLIIRRRFPLSNRPHIVGYVAAGEVLAVGGEVSGIKPSQRVTSFGDSGSHAALRVVRADHCWVVPEGMDVKDAACMQIPFGTAYRSLFDLAHLQPGETVLVQGASSGVGVAAVQLAKRAGARVIGTGSSIEQLEALRPLGLDEAVAYSIEDMPAKIRDLTGGKGVNVAIDQIGGSFLQKTIDSLAEEGRAVMVGLVDQAPNTIDATGILLGRKTLIGCMLGVVTHMPAVRKTIQDLLERVHAGELKAVIDQAFPLAEAAAAHRRAETRGRNIGRIVMIP